MVSKRASVAKMAEIENIVALLASVANYGGQIAAALHNCALTCDRHTPDFEGGIAIFDATVVTLKQVLGLVRDHVEHGKNLFSQQGLEYARLLALESGNTFIRFETTTKEGVLSREERRALKKETTKRPVVVPASILANLTLDEKSFLESVEKEVRDWKKLCVWGFIERLYDLQLHLLLLYQVVTVGALSKDVSSGKVDIQSIVSYHNRIKRAANLVGIETRKDRRRRPSFSDSSSASDSDSDFSTTSSVTSRPMKIRVCSHPPLPRAPYPSPPLPPSNFPPGVQIPKQNPVMPPSIQVPGPIERTVTMSPCKDSQQGNPPAYVDRPAMSLNEKDSTKEGEEVKVINTVRSTSHKTHLFKTQPNGLAFKLKSIFRSRESLAKEMKQTLKDNESELLAFVIHAGRFDIVPHSAFHSLESTHIETILSQLRDNLWYNTFTTLTPDEHSLMLQILSPVVDGKVLNRELVVLKLLREQKYSAALKLLNLIPRTQPYPTREDDRAFLVIVREKLVDGKPLMHPLPWHPPRSVAVDPVSPDIKEREVRQSLTSFAEYIIRFRDHDANAAHPLAPTIERVHNNQSQIRQRAECFELNGGNVVEMTLLLTDRQSEHASILMKEIRCSDKDVRYEWSWVEVSLHNRQGEITDFQPHRVDTRSIVESATIMHLIAKRSLRPQLDAVGIRKALMHSPNPGPPMGFNPGPPPATLSLPFPPPPPVPRGPVGGPFLPPPRPPVHIVVPTPHVGPRPGPRPRPNIRIDFSDSTDTTDSSDSSDSSTLDVRGQLRQAKKRQLAKRSRTRRGVNDADSDASSIDEEDSIVIDLQLKKRDDVVTKLLEIWTPRVRTKGM